MMMLNKKSPGNKGVPPGQGSELLYVPVRRIILPYFPANSKNKCSKMLKMEENYG